MTPPESALTVLLDGLPVVWPTILALDTGRYLVAAGLMSAILMLLGHRIEARRIQNRRPDAGDRRREIGWSLVTALIFSVNGLVLVWWMAMIGAVDIVAGAPGWRIALGTVALIVLHDAWFYWLHRGLHTRLLFRRAHATHHRSRTPSPWAAYAFAPLEAVGEALFLPVGVALLQPLDPLAIFLFMGHMIARNVFGHCGFELLPHWWVDSPLTRWITTPTHHDMHHQHGRWNYGLYFTWWDRWSGTEHPDYRARFRANAGGRRAKQRAAVGG